VLTLPGGDDNITFADDENAANNCDATGRRQRTTRRTPGFGPVAVKT